MAFAAELVDDSRWLSATAQKTEERLAEHLMTSDDTGKKRVNTRGRKPPEVVRPLQAGPAAPVRSFERKGGGNLYVGGERNEHGTRVARRVACGRCGTEDHVPYAPRDSSKALCRSCAALILRAYEVGTRPPEETRAEICNLCGVPFRMPIHVVDDGDPLCPNCLRGFTTWSGSIDTPFAERQGRVLEPRKNGVVVRKRKSDPGGG